MIRLMAIMLLTGCAVGQVADAPAQTQTAAPNETTAPSQAPEQTPIGTPVMSKPAPGRFPFDQFPEFSAIVVGSLLSGDDRESHIYRSGKLLRTQGTEGLGYFLTDLETFDTYGITKLGCRSDSHPYFRAFPFSAARPGRKIERVEDGKESVDGHMCHVEEVTISGGDLALPIQLKFWEAEDLQGFPIKLQILNRGGRGAIQYKNVVLGDVDPSLFIRADHCADGLPEPPAKKPAAKKKKTAHAASNSQQ
jgi:hypothetical protein